MRRGNFKSAAEKFQEHVTFFKPINEAQALALTSGVQEKYIDLLSGGVYPHTLGSW